MIHKILLLFLVATAMAFPASAERAESLSNSRSVARSLSFASASDFVGSGVNPVSVQLPAVHPDLTSEISGVQKTGMVYPLAAPITGPQLSWETANGRLVSRIQIVSENAQSLRLHIGFADKLTPVELRVKGSLDNATIGPVTDAMLRNGQIWLPLTHGDSADLEIAIAESQDPLALGLSVDQVNVMPMNTGGNASSGILPQSLGLAQQPERDLACWSSDSAYPALQEAAAATALIHFVQDTFSYICSGTLLNDRGNTGTPWFATANHCVPNQATADTLDFEWLFQATTCNGSVTDSRYSHTYGGAQLLWTEFSREVSLLKLNHSPGPNTVFSGWDTQIQVNDPIWGVHHPKGDHTMVSQGRVALLQQSVYETGQGAAHILDEVKYVRGGTEEGSSGSGLFAVAGGKAYWKGTLFGGPVFDYQISDYSHFQGYYDAIKKWLNACLLPWGGPLIEGGSVTAYAASSAANCAAAAETRSCAAGTLSGSYTSKTCKTSSASCSLPWGGSIADGKSVTAYQAAESTDCAALAQTRTCSDGALSGSFTFPACVLPQTCPVSWNGAAPVADPGPDGTANLGARYRLDGSRSCNSDPPGAKKGIRYTWKRLSAPTNADGTPARFSLSGARTATPRFVAPLPGDYAFQLTVANRRLASPPENTTVHVGGVIKVTAPTGQEDWTLGEPLHITWSFSGIKPGKRFNLFLLTDAAAQTGPVHVLRKNIKPMTPTSGDYWVNLRSTRHHLRLLGTRAAIKICIPPIGKNGPLCGISEGFFIR